MDDVKRVNEIDITDVNVNGAFVLLHVSLASLELLSK